MISLVAAEGTKQYRTPSKKTRTRKKANPILFYRKIITFGSRYVEVTVFVERTHSQTRSLEQLSSCSLGVLCCELLGTEFKDRLVFVFILQRSLLLCLERYVSRETGPGWGGTPIGKGAFFKGGAEVIITEKPHAAGSAEEVHISGILKQPLHTSDR